MKAFTFTDIDLSQCGSDEFHRVREAIPRHGVVLLKKQSFDLDQLVAITKRFGEPVHLPEGLRFNNTYDSYPEIARVSNVLPDGTLLRNHKAAEYWHSDGDFWQPGRNYLFNLLYAEVVPPVGGGTGFVDLRDAYHSLSQKTQNEIEDLSVLVRCDDIPDFKDAAPEERQPDARHRIKHIHVETGAVGLYIGHTKATIDGIAPSESNRIISTLVQAIEDTTLQYVHQWEPGDLLIWDNTSVMHRSMGGYLDHPRVLYRTQAFISNPN